MTLDRSVQYIVVCVGQLPLNASQQMLMLATDGCVYWRHSSLCDFIFSTEIKTAVSYFKLCIL